MSLPVLRWGIIGAGDIAERVMAPAMIASPAARLVAVCRRNRAAAEAFAERHGADRAYDTAEALLQDPEVDAVYLATPVDRHRPDTLLAAHYGKHVLCEKPMALNSAEATEMRDACAQAGVQFMMCFYQRLNARHRRIAEILEAGTIGRVVVVRTNHSGRSRTRPGVWRHDPAQAGGGCYMDSAIHCIDLVRYLCGEIVAATAFVDTLVESYPVEDTATSLLRLADGTHAIVTAQWTSGDPDLARNSMLEILGTDGVIFSAPTNDKFSRGELRVVTATGEEIFRTEQSTHVAVLDEFAAALAAGRPPCVTADDGIIALRVVEAVYESARTGRVVSIPHDRRTTHQDTKAPRRKN